YYRDRDLAPARLFHTYGVELSFVEHSVRLPGPVFVDDEVQAEAVPVPTRDERVDTFAVTLTVDRDGQAVPVLKGKVRVGFIAPDPSRLDALPAELAGRVIPSIDTLNPQPEQGA